jgi:hypothetical protein
MEESTEVKTAQASVQTNVADNVSQTDIQKISCCSHGGGVDGPGAVLVRLLGKLAPLSSERPEHVLFFY